MLNLRNMKATPLVIGGAVCLMCTLSAIMIGHLALDGDELWPLDQATLLTMKQMGDARPAKGVWMAWLTHLGDNWFLAGAAALGVLWQIVRRNWWLAVAWCVISLGGQALNDGIKNAVQRERPGLQWRDPAANRPRSYSFPSGHALGSTIIFGLLGYTMLLDAKRRLYALAVIVEMVLIIGAVSFSRVYLRVHWVSDVLAGLLIGTAWLALTLGLLESWRRG